MGKFNKGILGGFTGKVGTVIGSTWRGINYMRSIATPNKNRQFSGSQIEQQARFALITSYLSPVRPFLEVGFRNFAKQRTGYNSALAVNIKNAIAGTFPAFSIDHSMVLVSRGDLPVALNPQAAAGAAGELDMTWVDNTGMGKAKATDQLLLLVHCPAANESAYAIGSAVRSDAAYTMALPASFSGHPVHTYISFASVDGKEVSDSIYNGPVNIL